MAEKTKLELFKELVGTKLSDIKQLFAEEVVPVEFTDMKLKDGTIVRVSGGMKEGAKVMVVSETGEVPAVDGTHELENGTTIEVKDGLIVSVKEVAPEEAASTEPAKMDEEMKEVKDSIKSITYKYAEVEKKLADMVDKASFDKIVKENEALKAQSKAMFSLVEAIAGLPVDEPIQTPRQTTGKGRLAEFREEVKAMKAARRELRN